MPPIINSDNSNILEQKKSINKMIKKHNKDAFEYFDPDPNQSSKLY